MCTADLLKLLREQGFPNVQAWDVAYYIKAGYVERPPLNGAKQFVWGPKHVRALTKYLAQKTPHPKRAAMRA